MDSSRFDAPIPEDPWPQPQGDLGEPEREPMVNAPWPVATLSLGIVALYLLQSRFQIGWVSDLFSFSPATAFAEPYRLLSSQFVHGNWAHALMNAAFILAFGAPVARFFGPRLLGVVGFYGFYLASGALACLGFAALHWGQPVSLIGASGAASGLMGAAARLIGGQGRVGPITSPAVASMALGWIVVNIIMAFTGGALIPGAGDAGVGWEAHLAGFAAGLVLIQPFALLAPRR